MLLDEVVYLHLHPEKESENTNIYFTTNYLYFQVRFEFQENF